MFFSSKKKREQQEQERLEKERQAEEERGREEERKREIERLEQQRKEDERQTKLRRAQEEGSLYNFTVSKVIVKDLKNVEMEGENSPFVELEFGNDFKYKSPKVDDAGNKAEWNITGTPDHITYPALHDFNLSPFLYHTLLLSFRTRGLHVYFALLVLHVM